MGVAVSWSFETAAGVRIKTAQFHPVYGVSYPESSLKGRLSFMTDPPRLDSPTIQISDIKMSDEGRYICEFATYPSGSLQGVTNLVVLAKPSNTASTVTVQAGTAPVAVARCQSANGRPPATISWVTSVGGNGTTLTEKESPDRTVTVKSEFWLVPTPADNGRDVSCEVSHRTLSSPETFPMKLEIEYAPQVQIVGYDSNWYLGRTNAVLTCQAQGNPPPTTFTWRTTRGQMPETVQVKENTLTVPKVDETVNTTFICEVRNRVGTGTDQVSVTVWGSAELCKQFAVWGAVGFGSAVVLTLINIVLCIQRKRGAARGADVPAPKSGDDTYSALNPNTTSPDYDTLTPVRDSPSDTYSVLNPETRTSDYDTLTVVRPHPVMRRAPENEN
ncbi:hypothetical protein MHYP_G00361770 [Metynnis hypsauchen]